MLTRRKHLRPASKKGYRKKSRFSDVNKGLSKKNIERVIVTDEVPTLASKYVAEKVVGQIGCVFKCMIGGYFDGR